MSADPRILYGTAVAAVITGTSAAVAIVAASAGATPTWWALAALGAAPLGIRYAERIARPIVTRLLRPVPAPLPRVAPLASIPSDCRTLVVVPAIIATPEHARQLLGRLARLAREHDDPNARFALLADFADATARTMASDADILREEQRLVERINAELRDGAGDRVCVLHRERTWYAADRTWIGWERKRGKVLELNRLLVGRSDTSYRWMFGELARQLDAGAFPYIFVLDESNWLTRRDMLSVLRVAAHPANRAQLDADRRRLVDGYAIFAPAVVHSTIPPVVPPRFPFDVLGVGVFEGKGLLDVRACHALLDDVFPPGVVLQHDPLEGFVARTAEIRDAFVLDALAPGYLQQIQRGHRWLRGYVQLLPWVLPRVRGSDGAPRANPVPRIHRLMILEWVLTELARPASLILLIAGWLTLRAHTAVWTVLVCPPLALLLARLVGSALTSLSIAIRRASHPPVRRGGLLRFLHASGVDGFATLFSQAMLPYESMIVLDAFCRAAWRMLVSRRHLLDWKPVSRVQQGAWLRARREYRRVSWVCYATGLCTLGGVVAMRPGHLVIALPFAAAWIGAPKLVSWLDGTLSEPMAQTPVTAEARRSDLATAPGAA